MMKEEEHTETMKSVNLAGASVSAKFLSNYMQFIMDTACLQALWGQLYFFNLLLKLQQHLEI